MQLASPKLQLLAKCGFLVHHQTVHKLLVHHMTDFKMCINELKIVGRLLVNIPWFNTILVISWSSTVHTVHKVQALSQIVFITVGPYCEYTLAKILRQAGLKSFSSV